ncbi:hypothetical protein C0991_008186 [Blastosporella zonata]|nr:hypothetical protein C0991_008186 [Blastosporella zonata]
MGEVTYYEHDWERRLARLYLGPTFQLEPAADPTLAAVQSLQDSSSDVGMSNYVQKGGRKGMEDLPTELLCNIFDHTVSNFTPISTKGSSTPATLSQVSRKWHSVAIGYSWLWNDIVVDCGDWSEMPRLLDIAHEHLQRSGDLPITIRTLGSISPLITAPMDTLAIHNLVAPYAGRIRHLTLAFPVDWMNNFLRHTANPSIVELLESVKLVYHPTRDSAHLGQNNIFTHAHALRKLEIEYVSELGWKYLDPNTVSIPWGQITELNLIHVVASPSYMQAILSNCSALEKCTLSIIKVADDLAHAGLGFLNFAPPSPSLNNLSLPSVKHLKLYNPKNFDYIKYLAGLRVHFPNLEHFSIASSGDPRNGRVWSQPQFAELLSEIIVPLRSVSTPAQICDTDIESIIGEVPSLVELDVRQGDPISRTTVRLMMQGYLACKLEVLKCAVTPELLSSFLDMVESRYVSRKSKAKYRGFKIIVIRCPKDSDGYREVQDRIEDLTQCGRDITVVEF